MEPGPFIADDAPADDEMLLSGLAQRLAWTAAGAGVVLLAGSVAPAWIGLVVLAVWFLPLLCLAGFRMFAAMLVAGMVGLVPFSALSWPVVGRVVGFVGVTMLEECVLVLTVALLGGWLL